MDSETQLSAAISDVVRRTTDLRIAPWEEFVDHYALTIAALRENLRDRVNQVRSIGFDDRFLRLWQFYLGYCEAGFLELKVGVAQYLLCKPQRHGAG